MQAERPHPFLLLTFQVHFAIQASFGLRQGRGRGALAGASVQP